MQLYSFSFCITIYVYSCKINDHIVSTGLSSLTGRLMRSHLNSSVHGLENGRLESFVSSRLETASLYRTLTSK